MGETAKRKKGKNEVGNFLRYYNIDHLYSNGLLERYTFSNDAHNLLNILIGKLIRRIDFDRPDGYFFDKETSTLYIFEHFSFDCSPNGRKGSKLRKNIDKVNDEIEKEVHNSIAEYNSIKVIEQGFGIKNANKTIYHVGANGDIYRNNYIENFKKVYEGHAKKLQSYVEHCKREIHADPGKIATAFLIEDVTMAGTYFKNGDEIGTPVNLLRTKQFLETFINSQIDYILFGMRDVRGLSICDKSIIDVLTQDKDLLNEEFYVVPAMPQITFAKKTNLENL